MASLIAVVFACVAAGCALFAWRSRLDERRRSDARVAALAAAIDAAHEDDAPPLFDPPSARGAHPLMTIAAGFAVVAAIIFIGAMVSEVRAQRPPDAAGAANIDRSEIALVAMNHNRQGDAFVIHGLVRNQGTRRMSGLVAVVTVLDSGGQTVATGRAPIGDQQLPPGESSTFRIQLDGVRTVERYRVSFVGPDGGIVRHLDVRSRAAASSPMPGLATPVSAGF